MKIPVKTLAEEVADRIREMIRSGDLRKGDRILENVLCQTLGVSRTPLREALRILSSEGLIQVVAHKGAYVAEPSMKDVREMFEVMSLLEGECAKVAAAKITEDDLRRVEELHDQLEKHFAAKDHEAYLEVNHAYHVLIQEIAGNRVLNGVLDGLRQKVLLYRYRQLYQPDRFQASIREHRRLVEAFRKRDSFAAERFMKEHLMNQCESLTNLYANGGSGSETVSNDPSA